MRLLVSFCNQPYTPRLVLGILDTESSQFRWIDTQAPNADGVAGLAKRNGLVYVAYQSRVQPSIAAYDEAEFRLVSHRPLENIKDVHSLLSRSFDSLLVVSTGTNEIYDCKVKAGEIVEEELFWRFPGTEPEKGDLAHLNSVCVTGSGRMLASYTKSAQVEGFHERGLVGGGIIDVDANDVVTHDVESVHSLQADGDDIYYCMQGPPGVAILDGPSARFDGGFSRGLCLSDGSAWVGVSSNRWKSRSTGKLTFTDFQTFRSFGAKVIEFSRPGLERRCEFDLGGMGLEIYDLLPVETEFSASGVIDADPVVEKVYWLQYRAMMSTFCPGDQSEESPGPSASPA